jgi:cation transport regulator ChaC
MEQSNIWVFSYGSLIWGTGPTKILDRRDGVLTGWHREWTWISTSARPDAPTCSLMPGGQVKGVFFLLMPNSVQQDLERFRRRERRETEEVVREVPAPGAETHFWTMGNNLANFQDLSGLAGQELARALAARARQVTTAGSDGVLPADYIRRIHKFDPGDPITAEIAGFL